MAPWCHFGSERAVLTHLTTARFLFCRSKPFRRSPHPSLRWRNPAPHRLPGAWPLAAPGAGPLIGRCHATCSRNTAEPVLHPVPGPAADGCSAAHADACAPAGLPAAPAVDAAVMRRAELTGALVAGTPRRAAVAACCRIVRAWPQFYALTGCSVIMDSVAAVSPCWPPSMRMATSVPGTYSYGAAIHRSALDSISLPPPLGARSPRAPAAQ